MPKFEKGQSGNPNGRPVGAKSLTTKVKEALLKIADGKDYTYEEALIKSILKKAIVDGDSNMIRLMWNYIDGMPQQDINMGGDIKIITPEQVKKAIDYATNTKTERGHKQQEE